MRIARAFLMSAVLLTASACGEDDPEDTPTATSAAADGVVDLRFELPDVPEGGQQWLTPNYVIPAYSERQFCYYTTYRGPDVGIDLAEEFQEPTYGHHALMLKANVSEDDYPDGYSHDCTTVENMVDMEPFYFAYDNPTPGYHVMELSNIGGDVGKLGVSLKSGTRLIIQSHYVNYSDRDILVRDAINLRFMSPEDVDTWASSWSHTDIDIALPPNAESTLEVRCSWDFEVTLMNMFGHMHEKGVSVSIDHMRAGSDARERVYTIDQWDIEMRDDFPVQPFEPGTFKVSPGDSFVTTCTWFNDTDEVIGFPQEMCASSGLMYPAKVPVVCEADPSDKATKGQ